MALIIFLAAGQGSYYLLTGLWSLIHIKSFQWVTGPKRDLWLVKTVGALLTMIGSLLIIIAWRSALAIEWQWLALGTALILAAVDSIYAFKKIISPIYLLDALVEILFALVWLMLF